MNDSRFNRRIDSVILRPHLRKWNKLGHEMFTRGKHNRHKNRKAQSSERGFTAANCHTRRKSFANNGIEQAAQNDPSSGPYGPGGFQHFDDREHFVPSIEPKRVRRRHERTAALHMQRRSHRPHLLQLQLPRPHLPRYACQPGDQQVVRPPTSSRRSGFPVRGQTPPSSQR